MEKETKTGLKILGALSLAGLATWGIAKVAKAAPPLADYRVAIGFYDSTIPKYVLGTIIVDGVRHDIAPPYHWWEDILSEGIHLLDAIIPAGYEFDEVAVGDEETHEVIYTIDELPASIEIDRDIGIRVVIRPIAMLFGIATDTTTGNPIAGVTIIFNGKETYTNAAGEYAITGLEFGSLVLAFSHIDYEAYQVEITLSLGENRLDVSLTPVAPPPVEIIDGRLLVAYAWWEGRPSWNQIMTENEWPTYTSVQTRWKVENTGNITAEFRVEFMGQSSAITLIPGESDFIDLTVNSGGPDSYSYTANIYANNTLIDSFTLEIIAAAPSPPPPPVFDPWYYDLNGDCYISGLDEITQAALDRNNGIITWDQYREIAYLYTNHIRNPACV